MFFARSRRWWWQFFSSTLFCVDSRSLACLAEKPETLCMTQNIRAMPIFSVDKLCERHCKSINIKIDTTRFIYLSTLLNFLNVLFFVNVVHIVFISIDDWIYFFRSNLPFFPRTNSYWFWISCCLFAWRHHRIYPVSMRHARHRLISFDAWLSSGGWFGPSIKRISVSGESGLRFVSRLNDDDRFVRVLSRCYEPLGRRET